MRAGFMAIMAGVIGSGCYWSDPPSFPYGHASNPPKDATPLTTAQPPPPCHSPRILVLGRFDSVVTQPIGGLYDWSDYQVSPLFRTYYFKHAHLEIFEHTSDALRAAGLDVRKDYGTTGEPGLVEAPLRAKAPLLVRTTILALQHDQVRTDDDPPRDFEVVRLVAEVSVADLQGGVRYREKQSIRARVDARDPANLLRLLGLELGRRLLLDPGFLRAIEAERGAS